MKDRAIRRRRDIDAVAESEDCCSLQRRRDIGVRVKSYREVFFLFFCFFNEGFLSAPATPTRAQHRLRQQEGVGMGKLSQAHGQRQRTAVHKFALKWKERRRSGSTVPTK